MPNISAPANSSPTAQKSVAPASKTDDVYSDAKKLQQALKDKGFYKGEVDGDIGPQTQNAIKAFKVANKLKADHIVGPKVKELLGLK